MRNLLAVVAVLAPSFCLAAGDSPPRLEAAFSEIRQALPRVAMRDVHACFEREANPRADELGLPRRFCVERVGTRLPADAVTPFEEEGSAVVEGAPSAGFKHISGGARRKDGGWDIDADLFQSPDRGQVCGRLNTAFAAVYFSVDAAGRPLEDAVSVRGFMMDGSSLCRSEAKAVELEYKRVP